MGFLDNVERGLERAVNGAFARTFRSGVQPVEIAAALKRHLDIGAVVVDRDRVLAPNDFVVHLSPQDEQRLAGLGTNLIDELVQVVHKHAKRQQYQLLGGVHVVLRADESLTPGIVQVDASSVQGSVNWTPVLDIAGQRHTLKQGKTVIGRGSDADITINDSGTSRKHVEISWNGTEGIARDLGSTNGSKINGQRFREAKLEADTEILIGQTRIIFRLLPLAAPATPAANAAPSAPPTVATSTPPASASNNSEANIDKDFWQGL